MRTYLRRHTCIIIQVKLLLLYYYNTIIQGTLSACIHTGGDTELDTERAATRASVCFLVGRGLYFQALVQSIISIARQRLGKAGQRIDGAATPSGQEAKAWVSSPSVPSSLGGHWGMQGKEPTATVVADSLSRDKPGVTQDVLVWRLLNCVASLYQVDHKLVHISPSKFSSSKLPGLWGYRFKLKLLMCANRRRYYGARPNIFGFLY